MDSEKPAYIEYKYRWIIVALYAASSISGSIVSGAAAPIATKLSQTYGVTPSVINIISMIYLLAYAVMNFPANYFIDGKGLRVGVMGSLYRC
jgi:fucose permease